MEFDKEKRQNHHKNVHRRKKKILEYGDAEKTELAYAGAIAEFK